MKKIKLRNLLILLVTIAMLAFTLMQIIYSKILIQANARNDEAIMTASVKQAVASVDSYLSHIDSVAREFAYSEVIRNYLNANDPYSEIPMATSITALARAITMTDSTIESVLLIDMERLIIGNVSNSDFVMIRRLVEQNISMDAGTGEPQHFYYLSDARVMSQCIIPLKHTRLDRPLYAVLRYSDDYLANARRNAFSDRLRIDLSHLSATPAEEISQDAYAVVGEYGWTAYGTLTRDAATSPYFREYGYIMTAGILVILISMTVVIYTNITKPVTSLALFMARYGKTYSHERVAVSYFNEVGTLADSVNHMLDDIDRMTRRIVETQEKLYMAEIAEKQARFEALQIQMNPHFLNNTLECLRGIALDYGVEPIVRLVSSMNRILRYNLSEQTAVRLSEEVACVMDYIEIVNLRKGGIYRLETAIAPELMDKPVHKMLLQPLVENAVHHGLEERPGTGCIRIEAEAGETGDFLIRVRDNGAGMSKERLEKLHEELKHSLRAGNARGSGIGLINVDRRLRLAYGDAYGLAVESRQGIGTTVVMRIPRADS